MLSGVRSLGVCGSGGCIVMYCMCHLLYSEGGVFVLMGAVCLVKVRRTVAGKLGVRDARPNNLTL